MDNLDPSLLKCPGTGSSENEMLKDSYSEPDCTMAIGSTPSAEQILAVPTHSGDVYTASGRQVYSHSKGPTSLEASNNRRHMMIRSQVIITNFQKMISIKIKISILAHKNKNVKWENNDEHILGFPMLIFKFGFLHFLMH